ncbi:cytochrome c [Sphingomonas sp. 32-62-10]|uniref:cytochrome c n=1 Tax=Sphingomonas sp. 32-62-10 TaxID=1970436 RepID=UPI000BD08FC1|nr:MAG: hypothetical protein B7Z43_02845 [Sphingomonas sp. 12-62-6]OYX38482.1 MAG: hypothetical protein B7Y98_08475 [Sphingomonas sp. 32-62-10]
MRATPMIAALLVSIASGASAGPRDRAETEMARDGHSAIIAGRQAAFKLTLASFVGLKAAITRGDDPKTLVLPASAIAAWGKAIPSMFPAHSDGPASKALPTIWSDGTAFEARATDMAAAADKLAALAKAGNAAALPAQWDSLKGSCAACHIKYRAEDVKNRQ